MTCPFRALAIKFSAPDKPLHGNPNSLERTLSFDNTVPEAIFKRSSSFSRVVSPSHQAINPLCMNLYCHIAQKKYWLQNILILYYF